MNNAFQLNVESIVISSPSGREFDATYLFTQLTLSESLSSTAMSGTISLEDDHDHYELLPIIGQERLRLTVETLEKRFTFSFIIYKVSDVRKINARRSSYTLFFVSEEQYLNENKRLSRAYQNTTHDKIITDIMSNDIGTQKRVIVEETQGAVTYIAPNVRPFKAIRQLLKRSVSAETGGSNFVFFEDRRGYIISTLSTLIKQEAKYTYRHRESFGDADSSVGQKSDFFGIEKIDVKKQTDTLDALNNGTFASQLHSIDLFQRKVDVYDYGYFSEFDEMNHLNKHPIYYDFSEFDEEGNQYFAYTNETAMDNDYISESHSDMNIELTSETRLKRRLQLSMMNSYVLNMTIPGNVLLFIGDVIDIESTNTNTDKRSNMLSGNSLVTGITHIMSGNRIYKQRVETVKDSLQHELGAEVD